MPTMNRTALLTKLHKVLKKHYKPVAPAERPVLQHLLYACCLENAGYEAADKAFAAVSSGFFDWNEVRVSTVKELSEVMHVLPEAATAASNLKRILQGVFESTYSFDLESILKLNLGVAQQRLKKLEGCTPFAVSYVTQVVLDGHSIPIDRGTFDCLLVLGLVGEADRASATVPGMERAIPKNKGVEFASLVHQLGAEFLANPYSPSLHKILLEIAPECKDRLPKRPPKQAKATAAEPALAVPPGPAEKQEKQTPEKSKEAKEPKNGKESKEGKPAAAVGPVETAEGKAAAAKKKASEAATKPSAAGEKGGKRAPAEKPAAETARPAKKLPEKTPEKKKSAMVGLAKRKPR